MCPPAVPFTTLLLLVCIQARTTQPPMAPVALRVARALLRVRMRCPALEHVQHGDMFTCVCYEDGVVHGSFSSECQRPDGALPRACMASSTHCRCAGQCPCRLTDEGNMISSNRTGVISEAAALRASLPVMACRHAHTVSARLTCRQVLPRSAHTLVPLAEADGITTCGCVQPFAASA